MTSGKYSQSFSLSHRDIAQFGYAAWHAQLHVAFFTIAIAQKHHSQG